MKKKIVLVLLFVIVKVDAQTSAFSAIDSLFENGRYQLALKALKSLENPSFLSNYKTATIYESIDNYQQTAAYLEKALTFKEDKKASLKLARVYQKIGKAKQSITIYEDLVAKDSLNLVLKYQLGKLYLQTKNHKKSILIFKNLIQKDSINANYSYQLGLCYAYLKDRDRMINSFIDTYKKDSIHIRAIAHLASSFHKLQDEDSTKLFLDKGLILDKNHINLNKLKINDFYRDEKYVEAIPLLLNLDSIDAKDTYSKAMLGRVYYNLDSLEKAKTYFQKVFRIDRDDFKAQTYLGHIYLKQKNYRRAMFNYMMATRAGIEKRDEEYYGLATTYYQQKQPKLAIVNFEKAYIENPNNYKALYQLAKISDDYYKDKKIAYKNYKNYINRFEILDKDLTNFVKLRISEIKKDYFMKGETLD